MPEHPVHPITRAQRLAWWTILWLGMGSRMVVAPLTPGFVHPDEHQQYLEVAFGIVHGYHRSFWEYERGIRHYLYPGLLAGGIIALETVGIDQPLTQAAIFKWMISSGILAGIALFSWQWLREGKTAASFLLLAFFAFSPDIHYFTLRTLSEATSTVPLLLALWLLRRRPLAAGALCGLMFLIRFQTAFFIVGIAPIVAWLDWRREREGQSGAAVFGDTAPAPWLSLRWGAGLAAALLAGGLIDRLTWGAWFHSPWEYFQANIVEGIASGFGVEPWYYYLDWAGADLFRVSPVLLGMMLLGAARYPVFSWPALVFFMGHSLVGHKEYRFLWPAVPLAMCMAFLAFDDVLQWQKSLAARRAWVAVFALSLLAGTAWQTYRNPWKTARTGTAVVALDWIRRQPEVRGVLYDGISDADSGNYFYLRRNVPLWHRNEPGCLEPPDARTAIDYDYLVADIECAGKYSAWNPVLLWRVAEKGIFRIDPSGGAMSAR
jgi:GPI mannosyltransferase 3